MRQGFCIATAWFVLLAAPLAGQVEPYTEKQVPRVTPIVAVARAIGPAVVNVYQEVVEEVALAWPYSVLGPHKSRRKSVGSGVIIDPEGFIVTNAHVIPLRSEIRVHLANGTSHEARLVNIDAANDVALLKINVQGPLPTAHLASSSDVMVGETVIAIGNPLGNENTVTAGIVSSIFRDVSVPGVGERARYRDLIQLDAPINPGNSGGPLLNVQGEVIGINWAIASEAEGIGFAIPIDRVRRSLLGTLLNPLVVNDVVTGLEVADDGDEGRVFVRATLPDSPAERAGLRPGDRIMSVNGAPVTWEFDINKALFRAHPGDELPLVVQRGEELLSLEIALEAMESPMQHVLRATGMRVVDHPRFFGVVVESVRPASPAYYLVQRGDLIDGLDEEAVDDVSDLSQGLRQKGSRAHVTLRLFRKDQAMRGKLRLP